MCTPRVSGVVAAKFTITGEEKPGRNAKRRSTQHTHTHTHTSNSAQGRYSTRRGASSLYHAETALGLGRHLVDRRGGHIFHLVALLLRSLELGAQLLLDGLLLLERAHVLRVLLLRVLLHLLGVRAELGGRDDAVAVGVLGLGLGF